MIRLKTPAISIRLIEENLREKMLMHSIAAQEQAMIILGIFFFCIFFIIVKAASRIRRPTAILMPFNAFAMSVSYSKLSRNMEMR